MEKPDEKPKGVFGGGNFRSAKKFHKAVKNVFGKVKREEVKTVSEHLRGKVFEPSGLSKKEALKGIKQLKKEGKISWKDARRLKKNL
jgi:hypothetical protein